MPFSARLWALFGAVLLCAVRGCLAQKGIAVRDAADAVQPRDDPRVRRLAMADEMFGLMAAGKLKADVGQTFALADAAAAHVALESRQTTGATLLLP